MAQPIHQGQRRSAAIQPVAAVHNQLDLTALEQLEDSLALEERNIVLWNSEVFYLIIDL